MAYTIHIKPSGCTFTAEANETVFAAAQRHGLVFPHQTRAGLCHRCKGQLLEGYVHYDKVPAHLTNSDREMGYAVFCLAKPRSDLLIQLDEVHPRQQIPLKKLTYTVLDVVPCSRDIYQVFLQPPLHDQIHFQAGQYIEVLHRDTSPKPFSIASAPRADGQIELHIRHLPEGSFTVDLLSELQTKKTLRIAGPFGNAVYRTDPAYPFILIAGGIGFAPLKALVEQAMMSHSQQAIYLYWGVRTRADLYLHSLVKDWKKKMPHFHYIPVLSAPLASDRWKGRAGLVHEAVLADYQDFSHYHIYASGPPEMVYAALRAFQPHGLNRSLMYSDWFDYDKLL